jgi:hypothetical protein
MSRTNDEIVKRDAKLSRVRFRLRPAQFLLNAVVLSLVVTTTLEGRIEHQKPPEREETVGNRIRPAMIVWGEGTAAGLIETITPAVLGSRKTWRIAHYPQDPTLTKSNDYDLYDLDQTTLAPLRSVMNTSEYHLN